MKKNISINISGIIFHIEEDGYDSLKKYLDSVNRYFSNFEDSTEILADIESRIAEIFLTKLNEGKQVITADDVNNLIATMGNVSDFKAAEEDQEFAQAETRQSKSEEKKAAAPSQPKRLFRDLKRKIIGGVCAGLANYFNTDPLWIRLVLALLFFAYGFGILAYLILWIVIPGSNELEDTSSDKKMFRDPEQKVLGGVCGGVAAFFGIDIVVVRLIFVALTFAGGLGVIAYIVLWIILPEAKSLTDKMQMQGEPVTLSNIESTIKKNTGNETGEESTLTKIILFPFRLIAMIITALGKILRPLVEILRVGVGVFITFMGIVLVLSVLICGGILIGVLSVNSFQWAWGNEIATNLPIEPFSRAISPLTGIAGFFGAFIPSVGIMLIGVSIIA
ncbi:MAG: PspC domain-containing protein, partial [Flammeovirgaceae bacterium]|nr:PspC domain-containing protein [Flammeovirgaceae bacterium]